MNNAQGRRGIATYYKDTTFSGRNLNIEHKRTDAMQMTVLRIPTMTTNFSIINIYRSNNDNTLQDTLVRVILPDSQTLVVGDFNLCFRKNPNNKVSAVLKDLGFSQIVNEATHIEGGTIDHAYFRGDIFFNVDASLYSPYYTSHDHDCILITIEAQKE